MSDFPGNAAAKVIGDGWNSGRSPRLHTTPVPLLPLLHSASSDIALGRILLGMFGGFEPPFPLKSPPASRRNKGRAVGRGGVRRRDPFTRQRGRHAEHEQLRTHSTTEQLHHQQNYLPIRRQLFSRINLGFVGLHGEWDKKSSGLVNISYSPNARRQ